MAYPPVSNKPAKLDTHPAYYHGPNALFASRLSPRGPGSGGAAGAGSSVYKCLTHSIALERTGCGARGKGWNAGALFASRVEQYGRVRSRCHGQGKGRIGIGRIAVGFCLQEAWEGAARRVSPRLGMAMPISTC